MNVTSWKESGCVELVALSGGSTSSTIQDNLTTLDPCQNLSTLLKVVQKYLECSRAQGNRDIRINCGVPTQYVWGKVCELASRMIPGFIYHNQLQVNQRFLLLILSGDSDNNERVISKEDYNAFINEEKFWERQHFNTCKPFLELDVHSALGETFKYNPDAIDRSSFDSDIDYKTIETKTPGEAYTYEYFQDENNDSEKSDEEGKDDIETERGAESDSSDIAVLRTVIGDNQKPASDDVNNRKLASDNVDETNIVLFKRKSIPTNRFVSPTNRAKASKRGRKVTKSSSSTSRTTKRIKRGKGKLESGSSNNDNSHNSNIGNDNDHDNGNDGDNDNNDNIDNGCDNVNSDDDYNVDIDDLDHSDTTCSDKVVNGKGTDNGDSAGSSSSEVVNNSPSVSSDKTDSNDKIVNDSNTTVGDSASVGSSTIVGDSTVDNGSSIVNNSASGSSNNVVNTGGSGNNVVDAGGNGNNVVSAGGSDNTSSNTIDDSYRQGLRAFALSTFYRRLEQSQSQQFLAYVEMNRLADICVALDDSSSTTSGIQRLLDEYYKRTNEIVSQRSLDGRLDDINTLIKQINQKMFPRSPSLL